MLVLKVQQQDLLINPMKDRKRFKLKIYKFWEDALEVRLAGIKASIAKLEEQMTRDE